MIFQAYDDYGTVRYLYSLADRGYVMQITNRTIMQKMHVPEPEILSSSVSKVECYICGKGLEDGHSITAKTLPNGTVLFCDVHYTLQ